MTKEEMEKMKMVGNHEAAKATLKRLGKIRGNLECIFMESRRHCMHRFLRPDSPAWFCNKRDPDSLDGKFLCVYIDCPYVNGEAI